MRTTTALASLVLLCGTLAAVPPAERVPALIAELGSPDYAAREAASKELEALGGPALEALQRATASTDMEVSRRAAGLVEKIARRLDHERTLAPTLVELNAADVPLAAIAADLEKQTAYRIAFDNPELAKKKLTVKTAGRVPFWEAIALVCEKAGAEVASATPGSPANATATSRAMPDRPPPLPAPLPVPPRPAIGPGGAGIPNVQRDLEDMARRRQELIDQLIKRAQEQQKEAQKAAANGEKVGERLREQHAEMVKILQQLAQQQAAQGFAHRISTPAVAAPGTVLLRAKPGPVNPTCYSGAVRIESIPVPGWVPAVTPRDTVVAVLDAIAEPRLTWERVESVRVTKAVDLSGRLLTAAPVATGPVAVQERQIAGGRIVVGGDGGVNLVPGLPTYPDPSRRPLNNTSQAFLRLNFDGDAPPKTLKELEGVIRAQVRTAAEEIAAVTGLDANPAPPAAGEPKGVVLKVVSVNPVKDAADTFELDVSVQYNPTQVQVANAGTPGVTERVVNQAGGRLIVRQQMAAGVMIVNGKMRNGFEPVPPGAPTAFGLSVLDADGKPFELTVTKSVRQYDQAGIVTDQIRLTAHGSGKPAKVTFSGTRSKTVEVPFKLSYVFVTAGAGPVTVPGK